MQRLVTYAFAVVCFYSMAVLPSSGAEPDPPSVNQTPKTPDESNPAAACWQVVAYGSDNEPKNYASSFAVDEHLLATNAHVVESFAGVIRKGGYVRAFQSDTGAELYIADVWIHPGYDPDEHGVGPDVGLLAVFDSMPSVLPLADDRALKAVTVLTSLHLYGFPGDISVALEWDDLKYRTLRPIVTCLTGRVTSIRNTSRRWFADYTGGWLIQHDMAATGGTSGSPILNAEGAVVAINMGGTSDEHGQNGLAIRSDVLDGLLRMVRLGVLPSVDTFSDPNIGNDNKPDPEPALIRLLDDTAEAVGGWPIASIICLGMISLTFLQLAKIRAKPQKRLTEAMNRFVDVLGQKAASAETGNSTCSNGDSTNAKPE